MVVGDFRTRGRGVDVDEDVNTSFKVCGIRIIRKTKF